MTFRVLSGKKENSYRVLPLEHNGARANTPITALNPISNGNFNLMFQFKKSWRSQRIGLFQVKGEVCIRAKRTIRLIPDTHPGKGCHSIAGLTPA